MGRSRIAGDFGSDSGKEVAAGGEGRSRIYFSGISGASDCFLFQAGSICDYIKAHWGEDKLLDMVHSYAQRRTTVEVIQSDLGVSPEEFDKQYLAYIDGRYGKMAASFDQWRK